MRYDKKEFAQKEGVTMATLNAWIYDHGLPIIQIGRKTYITDEDFAEWFTSHKTTKNQTETAERPQKDYTPRNLHPKPGIEGKLRLAR